MTAERWTGRLPWPRPQDLTSAQRVVYDAITGGPRASGERPFALTDEEGRLCGPFNAMLLSPAVGGALQELGVAIRYESSLSDRCREIAILVVAAWRRSEFEWYAHERVGTAVGLQGSELAALRDSAAPPATFSPPEVVVHQATREMLADRTLTDETYHRVVEHVGRLGLQELIALVGYYDILALQLQVWDVPLPPGIVPTVRCFGPTS